MKCKAIQCRREAVQLADFCASCLVKGPYDGPDPFSFEAQRSYAQGQAASAFLPPLSPLPDDLPLTLAQKYPQYYKNVSELNEVDVYAVHYLFDIQDPSGALQHASKKLLLSGARTGGKSAHDDIREARDTLNRWLELNLA